MVAFRLVNGLLAHAAQPDKVVNIGKRGVTQYLSILDDDQAVFFDFIPLLLVVIDRAGNIVRINKAFEDTVGYSRYEICGINVGLSRFVVMEDIIKFIRAFDETRHPSNSDFRFRHKDGREIWCRLIRWQYRRNHRSFLIFAKVMEQ